MRCMILMSWRPIGSRNEFVGAFSIEPYTPDRQFILTRYQDLLGNKDLKPS